MVLVLIVDLGLAAAGAALLYKGLAADSAPGGAIDSPPEQEVEQKVEQKTEAPTAPAASAATLAPSVRSVGTEIAPPTAAPPPPTAPSTPSPAPEEPPSAPASSAAAAARKDNTKQRDDAPAASTKTTTAAKATSSSTAKSSSTTKTSAARTSTQQSSASTDKTAESTQAGPAPEDPYQPPDTKREIDVLAGRSQSALSRCESHFGPASGKILIAFQVRGDGRVINAAAVENSTGNTDLANCLVTVVSSWRVSAHDGAPINMVRPFNFP